MLCFRHKKKPEFKVKFIKGKSTCETDQYTGFKLDGVPNSEIR